MSNITTVGIDLAKNVFSMHGVDGAGHVVLRKTVRREGLVPCAAIQRSKKLNGRHLTPEFRRDG